MTSRNRIAVATACALALAALLIYEPYAARPFDMRDFSEFVPLLRRDDSMVAQFNELTSYYATRGRANVIVYAALVAKWKLFGWDPVAWQLLRFVQMCVLVGTAFVVIRRFGADLLGALLGASLFVFAGSAAHGWVRLTMAEVLGTQLLLTGLLIASRYQAAADWKWRAVALAAIAAAMLLAKEMFIAAVPLMVVIGLCWQSNGTLALPRLTSRNIALVVACAIGTLATLVPLALVGLNAPAGAYTSTFGREGIPLFRSVVWIAGAATPYLVVSWRSPVWALVQLLAFALLVAAGWRALSRREPSAQSYRALFVLLALHLAAGALSYLPWPVYQPFYAMPFFIATPVIAGLAFTGSRRDSTRASALAAVGWFAVVGSAAVQALDYRRATDAEQRFNAQLTQFIAARGAEADSVLVATRRPLRGARTWQGFGATIARYGNALSYDMPPILDDDCEAVRARRLAGSRTTLILRYGNTCDAMEKPDTTLVRRYTRFDWDRMRPVADSFYAELYRGSDRQAP